MTLTEHDDVVQALPSDAADETLHIRVLRQAMSSRNDLGHIQGMNALAEGRAIDAIAVPHEMRWGLLPGKRLDHLLCCPLGGRMLCHIEVHDTPSLVSRNQ
jgi:hypothetical protein